MRPRAGDPRPRHIYIYIYLGEHYRGEETQQNEYASHEAIGESDVSGIFVVIAVIAEKPSGIQRYG
jgi:hypothetical protein